jgi:phosphomannomutase
VRDKDGISAALCLARVASRLREQQKTLHDRLAEIYREHGLWVSVQHNLPFSGASGAVAMRAAIDRLAKDPPRALGETRVRGLRDFRAPADRPRWLGKADLVELELDGGRALVRPSGTEPKLKIYVDLELPLGATTAVSHAQERGEARARSLSRALATALEPGAATKT